MSKKTQSQPVAVDTGTHAVMLRLPYSLHVRLQEQARRQTVPPAVLARMLVLDGINRLERQEGE